MLRMAAAAAGSTGGIFCYQRACAPGAAKQVEKRGSEGLWSSLKLWAAKKLDVVNADDATDAICRALVATAHRLQDDEQWRCWLYAQLQRVAGSVYGTEAWRELVQSLQNRALHDISLQSALKQLWII